MKLGSVIATLRVANWIGCIVVCAGLASCPDCIRVDEPSCISVRRDLLGHLERSPTCKVGMDYSPMYRELWRIDRSDFGDPSAALRYLDRDSCKQSRVAMVRTIQFIYGVDNGRNRTWDSICEYHGPLQARWSWKRFQMARTGFFTRPDTYLDPLEQARPRKNSLILLGLLIIVLSQYGIATLRVPGSHPWSGAL